MYRSRKMEDMFLAETVQVLSNDEKKTIYTAVEKRDNKYFDAFTDAELATYTKEHEIGITYICELIPMITIMQKNLKRVTNRILKLYVEKANIELCASGKKVEIL